MAKITVTLLDDTGSSPTDNVSMFDTLTGTGTPGATITFTLGGVSIGTTTADISGAWTFTPVGLANGNYKVTVSEPGASTWISFTLDTVAPAVTEVLVKDTGASATDNITSNPALRGTGDGYTVVTLTEGGVLVGTVKSNSAGNWSFTPVGMTQGTHTIVATETDPAGNVGSTSITFTLDTVAPVVTASLLSDTGTPGDNITTNPGLTGTADPNSVVTLKQGTKVSERRPLTSSGSWTFTPTGLAQGAHTIVASETDAAGNVGSASVTFTLDTKAPAVTEKLLLDTGISSTDKITFNPTVTGGGDANAMVTLTEGGKVLGTTTANATGVWTFTPVGLAQGANKIVANETDGAGNTRSASLTFTLDTVAPVVSESLVSDTGTLGDNITSNSALKGGGGAGAVVTLTEGGVVLGTTTADASGNWTYTPVSPPRASTRSWPAKRTPPATSAAPR